MNVIEENYPEIVKLISNGPIKHTKHIKKETDTTSEPKSESIKVVNQSHIVCTMYDLNFAKKNYKVMTD